MRFDLEYNFNNKSLPKFKEYEIKLINNIKYVVPKINNTVNMSNYTVISFDDYEENDKPLIDFINLGKLSLENEKETDSLLLNFVNIVEKHLQHQTQKLNMIHLAVKIKKMFIKVEQDQD